MPSSTTSPNKMSSITSTHNARELITYILSFPRRFSIENTLAFYSTSIAIFAAPIIYWFLSRARLASIRRYNSTPPNQRNAQYAIDTPFIREFSTVQSFTTPSFTYPEVRVFYHPHPHASKLPRELPLLVFIHGLGGQIGQWRYQINRFSRIAHVLAIDLPGCGGSSMLPIDWEAYTTPKLAELISVIVEAHAQPNQKYVLIGHSLGCALSATTLANNNKQQTNTALPPSSNKPAGFIGVCPKAQFSETEMKRLNVLAGLPFFIFDGLRFLDKRGGIDSPSVLRVASPRSSPEVRSLQLLFNNASRTPTALRFMKGAQLPSGEVWRKIGCPALIVAAAEDKLTPPGDADIVKGYLQFARGFAEEKHVESYLVKGSGHAVMYERPEELCAIMAKFLTKIVNQDLDEEWQIDALRKSVI